MLNAMAQITWFDEPIGRRIRYSSDRGVCFKHKVPEPNNCPVCEKRSKKRKGEIKLRAVHNPLFSFQINGIEGLPIMASAFCVNADTPGQLHPFALIGPGVFGRSGVILGSFSLTPHSIIRAHQNHDIMAVTEEDVKAAFQYRFNLPDDLRQALADAGLPPFFDELFHNLQFPDPRASVPKTLKLLVRFQQLTPTGTRPICDMLSNPFEVTYGSKRKRTQQCSGSSSTEPATPTCTEQGNAIGWCSPPSPAEFAERLRTLMMNFNRMHLRPASLAMSSPSSEMDVESANEQRAASADQSSMSSGAIGQTQQVLVETPRYQQLHFDDLCDIPMEAGEEPEDANWHTFTLQDRMVQLGAEPQELPAQKSAIVVSTEDSCDMEGFVNYALTMPLEQFEALVHSCI